MTNAMVIDLSHHNTIPESLEAYAASGGVGVIHKLTEGTSFVDDKVQARRKLATDAGLLWGIYHFIRPGRIEEQAEFFLQQASELNVADDDTLWVLDWEDTGVSLDDALDFLALIEADTGRPPIIYSGHVIKEALDGKADPRISRYLLWVCHYGVDEPVLPPGWDEYFLWQYTDQGHCPGGSVLPPVDLNDYRGSADDLRDEWCASEITPESEGEPEVTVTIEVRGVNPKNVNVRIVAVE